MENATIPVPGEWTVAKSAIESAWDAPELRGESVTREAVEAVLDGLDRGVLRCAEPVNGGWQVNEWVKKAVVLYFLMREMKVEEVGPFQFHDKMALKKNHAEAGVRVVPHAIARYGAFLGKGVVMMPSYVTFSLRSVQMSTSVAAWASGVFSNRFKQRLSLWRMAPSSGPAPLWSKGSGLARKRSSAQAWC